MGFIQREIDPIRSTLIGRGGDHPELYAAQQALEWSLEPRGIKSPYDMIMGTQEGLEDCSALSHLTES